MRASARDTWLTGTSRSLATADSVPSAATRAKSFRSSNARSSMGAMVGAPALRRP
jgi:hypothetical protein